MPTLKTIQSGATPLASDINQLIQGVTAQGDIGPLSFVSPQATPAAPTVAVNTTAGSLNGPYKYIVVLATGWKESNGNIWISGFAPSAESASVSPASQQVNLSALATGTTVTVGRLIYRTPVNGASGSEKFLAWIADNTTTTYTDNTPDSSLGTGMPTSVSGVYGTTIPATVPVNNSTGSGIAESTYLGGREMLPDYDYTASTAGNNGLYTVVTYTRPNSTKYLVSTLSNPDANGNYQTDTWQFYAADGTTVIETHTWTLTWDGNSKITKAVMS